MKKQTYRIGYFTIIQSNWKSNTAAKVEKEPFYLISDVLNYIYKLPKKNKFYDLKSDKFCFLENLTEQVSSLELKIFIGYFKSARNEFRPNIVNRATGSERKNPKEKSEGDIEKTHFIIRIDKKLGEVYLFLEHNHFGMTINNVINYFNVFSKKYVAKQNINGQFSLDHSIIARDNFLTELNNLSRAKVAEIHIEKKLLGSAALNFSDRTIEVQDSIKIEIKAERQQSIKSFGVDLFNKFNKNSGIEKIRIHGSDLDGNDTIIDTDFMSKRDYIEAGLDPETGEAISDELLSELIKIANTF